MARKTASARNGLTTTVICFMILATWALDRAQEKHTLLLEMKPSNGYRCLLLMAGIVSCSGCGLSEYQSKYEKQQERMNYLDQENLYLGQAITLPDKKDSGGPNISVRLPRGISTKHDEQTTGILYRYPKSSSKPPPGSNIKVGEIDSVFLAVEKIKSWKEFKKKALEAFKDVASDNTRRVSLEIPGRPTRTFETIAFTDGTEPAWAYRFYVFQDKGCGVAIGFRGSESALASQTARQAMEFSVKTVTVENSSVPATEKSPGS